MKKATSVRVALMLAAGIAPSMPSRGQWTAVDPRDALPRPMDPGANLPFNIAEHRMPDLRELNLERWSPSNPAANPFIGAQDAAGAFLHIGMVFDGLVNPPGPVDPFDFRPFRYGDHPVYGFVEIDMDGDADTGGELDAPRYRYLGNAVRFGGKASAEPLRSRLATTESDFDGMIDTGPAVERHGEEFHVALLGSNFLPSSITVVEGNGDLVLESGETWRIRGTFFHRAHAFELFSFVEGGGHPGDYSPLVDLRFAHDPSTNRTRVDLVVPLTNAGAGLLLQEPAQANNTDPTDHASIMEGLTDLQVSAAFLALFPTGLPEEALIHNWAQRAPEDHLDPASWRVTAIFGSSFTAALPGGVFFLWTDVFPDPVLGDVDGSGEFDGQDRSEIAQHISDRDADDGVVDGVATVIQFASNFSVYDTNHDGEVDALDLQPVVNNGDGDEDGDVDLLDVALFQTCFQHPGRGPRACRIFDMLPDRSLDLLDVPGFQKRLQGPGDTGVIP